VDLGIGQAEQVAVDRATGTATVVWQHRGFTS